MHFAMLAKMTSTPIATVFGASSVKTWDVASTVMGKEVTPTLWDKCRIAIGVTTCQALAPMNLQYDQPALAVWFASLVISIAQVAVLAVSSIDPWSPPAVFPAILHKVQDISSRKLPFRPVSKFTPNILSVA